MWRLHLRHAPLGVRPYTFHVCGYASNCFAKVFGNRSRFCVGIKQCFELFNIWYLHNSG